MQIQNKATKLFYDMPKSKFEAMAEPFKKLFIVIIDNDDNIPADQEVSNVEPTIDGAKKRKSKLK